MTAKPEGRDDPRIANVPAGICGKPDMTDFTEITEAYEKDRMENTERFFSADLLFVASIRLHFLSAAAMDDLLT